MIYVAWADGTLTADEIRKIGEMIEAEPWFDDEVKERSARGWTPPRPLRPAGLQALMIAIRWLAQNIPEAKRHSLAALGVALVGEIDDPKVALWSSAEAAQALREAQSTQGGS